MEEEKLELTKKKYTLPYHWMRDRFHKDSLPYFGYMDIVLRQLPPAPASVLDAGCGDGRISFEMIQKGYQVTGLDILPISVVYAQAFSPSGNFHQADLRNKLTSIKGIKKEQFEAILCVEVYEHLPPDDCLKTLKNLFEVLKLDGKLILTVPSFYLPKSQLHYRHFLPEEIIQELTSAGFSVEEVMYQQNLGKFTQWLLSPSVEAFLNNKWLQPVFLKRWRYQWYMKYSNLIKSTDKYGRIICIARKKNKAEHE